MDLGGNVVPSLDKGPKWRKEKKGSLLRRVVNSDDKGKDFSVHHRDWFRRGEAGLIEGVGPCPKKESTETVQKGKVSGTGEREGGSRAFLSGATVLERGASGAGKGSE